MSGKLAWRSAVPVDGGKVFRNVHVGAGANSKEEEGLGVTDATTLVADVTWRLRFDLPPTLPSGTAKLKIRALANATSGVLRLNPKWASVADEEDPSAATLNAEGNTDITWGAGDNDQYKGVKITLDADTLVGGEVCVMDLVIVDTGTTIAVVTTLATVEIIWE